MAQLSDAQDLLDAVGIRPAYLIDCHNEQMTREQWDYLHGFTENTWAFTSPVMDLVFKPGALKYSWRGRGFCCVFRKPPSAMTRQELLGTAIHEAGHYVEFCNCPERDDPDETAALRAGWCRSTTEADGHGARWVRATVHLWRRATYAGYSIDVDDLQLNSPRYKAGDVEASTLIDAIAPEAISRRTESIESILRSPLPPKLASVYGITQPQPRLQQTPPVMAPPANGTAQRATGKPAGDVVHTMFIGRRIVNTYRDGTTHIPGTVSQKQANEIRRLLSRHSEQNVVFESIK